MNQVVRMSGYKDYVALDFTDNEGNIIKTPFYLKNNHSVEVHWGRPSNERCEYPSHYDDFHDKYLFKMIDGKIYCRWLNGACWFMEDNFSEVNPDELIDWKFQYATKIKDNIKI